MVKSAVYGLPLVFLLIFNLPTSIGADCSNAAITTRLSKCVQLQFNDPSSLTSGFDSLMSQLCGSVECSIACNENALKDCLSTGIFRLVDFEINRVSMRYACDNAQALINAIKNCGDHLLAWSCFDGFFKTLYNVTLDYTSTGNSDVYFNDYCRASRDFADCTSVTPLVGSGTCSSQEATVFNNIYVLSASNARCGIAQESPLFTNYGGPPTVTTCGAESCRLLYLVLLTFLFITLFLQKAV